MRRGRRGFDRGQFVDVEHADRRAQRAALGQRRVRLGVSCARAPGMPAPDVTFGFGPEVQSVVLLLYETTDRDQQRGPAAGAEGPL